MFLIFIYKTGSSKLADVSENSVQNKLHILYTSD